MATVYDNNSYDLIWETIRMFCLVSSNFVCFRYRLVEEEKRWNKFEVLIQDQERQSTGIEYYYGMAVKLDEFIRRRNHE